LHLIERRVSESRVVVRHALALLDRMTDAQPNSKRHILVLAKSNAAASSV
jgi:hypothetical protein